MPALSAAQNVNICACRWMRIPTATLAKLATAPAPAPAMMLAPHAGGTRTFAGCRRGSVIQFFPPHKLRSMDDLIWTCTSATLQLRGHCRPGHLLRVSLSRRPTASTPLLGGGSPDRFIALSRGIVDRLCALPLHQIR